MVFFSGGRGGGKQVDYGYKGKGVTSHLLVERQGRPLAITVTSAKGDERGQVDPLLKKIKPLITDSIFDLYRKIYKTQIKILPEAIRSICTNNTTFKSLKGGSYHSYMSEEIQKKTINNLKSYIANYSKIT